MAKSFFEEDNQPKEQPAMVVPVLPVEPPSTSMLKELKNDADEPIDAGEPLKKLTFERERIRSRQHEL